MLWQATKWPLETSLSMGSSLRQASVALTHLGWNLQPGGGLMGVGTSPPMMARAFSSLGSGTGTAVMRAMV